MLLHFKRQRNHIHVRRHHEETNIFLIHLVSLPNIEKSHISRFSITISTTPTPYAILDLHFSPHDPSLLAVAGSTGCLQLFRFSAATTTLEPLSTYQFFDPAILALSLAWHPVDSNKLGITASDGGVYIVDTTVSIQEAMDTPNQILEHDLEAWTLSFSHKGNAIYSGGDDASLRFSTLATSESQEGEEVVTPIQWQDRRSHQAGVTAILPLATEENVLITGSYDDNIRILSTPLVGRKQILAEENLEGGVWRLKLLHQDSQARS